MPITGTEYFSFSSATLASDTVFFLFSNATLVGNVALVNTAGDDITTPLTNAAIGGETQLADFTFERESDNPNLNNREVFGNTFGVSEFDFLDGFSVADAAGFRGAGGTADINEAGIAIPATATVPEPSSAILLVGGLGTFLVRRRRK